MPGMRRHVTAMTCDDPHHDERDVIGDRVVYVNALLGRAPEWFELDAVRAPRRVEIDENL